MVYPGSGWKGISGTLKGNLAREKSMNRHGMAWYSVALGGRITVEGSWQAFGGHAIRHQEGTDCPLALETLLLSMLCGFVLHRIYK